MVRPFAHALPRYRWWWRWFLLNWPVEALGISSTAGQPTMDVSLHSAQDQSAVSPAPRAPTLAYSVVIQQLSTLADGPFTLGSAGRTVRSAPEPAPLCLTRPFDAQAI